MQPSRLSATTTHCHGNQDSFSIPSKTATTTVYHPSVKQVHQVGQRVLPFSPHSPSYQFPPVIRAPAQSSFMELPVPPPFSYLPNSSVQRAQVIISSSPNVQKGNDRTLFPAAHHRK